MLRITYLLHSPSPSCLLEALFWLFSRVFFLFLTGHQLCLCMWCRQACNSSLDFHQSLESAVVRWGSLHGVFWTKVNQLTVSKASHPTLSNEGFLGSAASSWCQAQFQGSCLRCGSRSEAQGRAWARWVCNGWPRGPVVGFPFQGSSVLKLKAKHVSSEWINSVSETWQLRFLLSVSLLFSMLHVFYTSDQ